MSSHDKDDAHDDDHGHEHAPFDPEPAKELGVDEPRTPPWAPILGVGLFVAAAIYVLASPDSAAQTSPSASASAVGQQGPSITSAAKPTPPRVNADQIAEMQKKLREAQAAKSAAPAVSAAPPASAAPSGSAASSAGPAKSAAPSARPVAPPAHAPAQPPAPRPPTPAPAPAPQPADVYPPGP